MLNSLIAATSRALAQCFGAARCVESKFPDTVSPAEAEMAFVPKAVPLPPAELTRLLDAAPGRRKQVPELVVVERSLRYVPTSGRGGLAAVTLPVLDKAIEQLTSLKPAIVPGSLQAIDAQMRKCQTERQLRAALRPNQRDDMNFWSHTSTAASAVTSTRASKQ